MGEEGQLLCGVAVMREIIYVKKKFKKRKKDSLLCNFLYPNAHSTTMLYVTKQSNVCIRLHCAVRPLVFSVL